MNTERRRTTFWLRLVGAAAAGGLMYAAFPPNRHVWWLAPVSLGLLYLTLTVGRPSLRSGASVGFVFGLAFFVPLLPWIGVYVGPLPWLALAAVMAGYLASFGVLACITMRLPWRPVWFALSWVTIEAVRSAFPFGGFPWGRTAFSQIEGPYLPLASIIGAPGVGGVIALSGAAGATALAHLWTRRSDTFRSVAALGAITTLVGPIVVGVVLSGTGGVGTEATGSAQVAAIQGNVPRLGLDFADQRRAVLDNHVHQTLRMAAQVTDGTRPQPDLVLWPENASDLPPTLYPDAAESVRAAVTAAQAPLAFGTWLPLPDGGTANSVLLWESTDGYANTEPSGRYDKHIVQPFGEYLPWRGFFRLFSSYADRAGDFRPGTGPAVLTAPTRHGDLTMGVATCWEVAFDRAAQQSVREGAQFLFVPTNNATFGKTDMTYQQLAMSQVRAVETGRSVVVAATSGVSALVAPDGSVISDSEIFTPDILQTALEMRSGQTPAVRLGPWPQRLVVVLTAGALLFVLRRRISLDMFTGRRGRSFQKEHDDQQAS